MEEKQGRLAHIGMPRLLHLIYRKGDRAAVLDIVRKPVKKRFFFKNGLPVAATSNILNEVLGRLLMKEGIITQEEYETSLQTVLTEKRKHGEVLISMGLITPEQLETFLALQLKRRLWSLYAWNDGTYRYLQAESVPETAVKAPPHPASLILEGITLGFYPAARLKADLKGYMDEPCDAVDKPDKYFLDDFGLNLQEKRFISSLDGAKTLREALGGSDLLQHRGLSIALSLMITGFIGGGGEHDSDVLEFFGQERPTEAEEASGGDQLVNAELMFMRARSALSKDDFDSAIKSLKEITALNPVEGEYWAYLGWAVYRADPEDVGEAEKIIKDAIDLNNDLDSAWYFLGMMALEKGDERMAQKAFRTAVEKNPWMLDAVSELKRLEIKRSLADPLDIEERRAYMNTLGFEEDPFAGAPDSRFLLLSESQTKALDFLVKAIRKKAAPALLAGPAGSGKTTLLLELLKRLSSDKALCAVILEPPANELSLLKELNREVDAPFDAPHIKDQLLNLGMRVSQNKIQGGQTVIIIDQAHRLTHGCLKLIQYLSRLKTLQIILFAEPEFADRLASAELNELDGRLTARHELKPMSPEETRAYVAKRLAVARKTELAKLTVRELPPEDAEAVHEQGKGIPADVNRAATHALKRLAARGAVASGAPAEAHNKETIDALEAPRIFPANEIELARAKKELEIDTYPEQAPAPVEPGAPEAAPTEAPVQARPVERAAAPAVKEKKRSPAARVVIFIIIALAATVIAGILTGVIDTKGLFTGPVSTEPGRPVETAPATPEEGAVR